MAFNLLWSGKKCSKPVLERRKRPEPDLEIKKTAEKNHFWSGENSGKSVLEMIKWRKTCSEVEKTAANWSGDEKTAEKHLFWSGENGRNLIWRWENGGKLVLERIKRPKTCSGAECDRCAPWRSSQFPGRDCGRKWRNRMWGDRPPSPLQPEKQLIRMFSLK